MICVCSASSAFAQVSGPTVPLPSIVSAPLFLGEPIDGGMDRPLFPADFAGAAAEVENRFAGGAFNADGAYAPADALREAEAETSPFARDASEQPWTRLEIDSPVDGRSVGVLDAWAPPSSGRTARLRNIVPDIWQDHLNYYSLDTAAKLGVAFSVAAVVANGDYDQEFRNSAQHEIGGNRTIHDFHWFGEGMYTLPTYLAAAGLGYAFDDTPAFREVGDWGEQTFRAAMVGAAPMYLMQRVTGGSRPRDISRGSHWHFFNDDNGVSGHSFMGALPFLTAAQMTDRNWLKAVFFGGSFLTAMSRVSDDKHYLSQVMLGWSMAGVAVAAVGRTESGSPSRIVPWFSSNGSGLGWERSF